ncbi:MAG TPA: ATP-binding protein [Rhodocyclaceae bacterium]
MERQLRQGTATPGSTARGRGADNRDRAPGGNATAEKLSAEVMLLELQMQNEELRAARNQAEMALKRFTDLYDSAPIGYLALRRDGSIRDANLAGARLLGAARATLRNARFAAFVDSADVARFGTFAENVFAGDARPHCELVLQPLGDRAPAVVRIDATRDERGQECRLAITDITERKEAERVRRRAEEELRAAKVEAERANEAKSRFLAAASHDLRQPLSALALYVGTLEESLPARDRELARNMRQCVAGLNELLSDLLDLSKLDAGAIVPKVCDFSLDSVLGKVASAMEPKARRKRLALRYRYGGRFGRTDPVLFRRIVSNLVANAIRYTERGGVLIACRRRQGRLWVEVWDTGVGIPAGQTSEIFEEFKQLGNNERNREQGTGIGLAIVAKEAALLGLQVRVESRVGRGSVFAVELPPGDPVVPAPAHIACSRPLRIAVVEDNAEVARALGYALSALGHTPVVGATGAAVLKDLAGNAPDIVVSDYRLSGSETGRDVVAAMRGAFGESLPAMVVTGDTDPALMRRMAKDGIVVQHKPVDVENLSGTLAELTERRTAGR